MKSNNKNQIVKVSGSFASAHPFLTFFIVDGMFAMIKNVVNSITYASSYKAYVKGFAGRAQDMAAPKNLNINKRKIEIGENENEEINEKSDIDSSNDSDVSYIFGNDASDDDLHG